MKLKSRKLLPVSAAVLLAFGSLYAVGAPAPTLTLNETITVSGTTDAAPTACTGSGAAVVCANLRSAIAHANANAVASTYTKILLANGSVHTLSVADSGAAEASDGTLDPATAYDNTVGDLDISLPVNIETTDNTLARATIEGGTGFEDRLLHINSTVNLTNLVLTKGQGKFMNGGAIYGSDAAVTTITKGLITDNYASWDGNYGDPAVSGDGTTESQGSGGAIYTKGKLTISFSTLSKNTASTVIGPADYEKNGNGGAIYSSQELTISDSTLGGSGVANTAINGGAIQMAGGNPLTITRSTLSHNEAVSGGAVNIVSPSAGATILNSTISANHATDAGGGLNVNGTINIGNTTIANNLQDSGNKGAGINQFSEGVVTLHNTLLSGNLRATTVSANCGKTGSATASIASAGGNLATDASCNLLDATDQQSVADAKIGALDVNGNSYNGNLTHALLSGSPAINKGTVSNCPATDERNIARPQGSVCDVGAYELIIPPAASSSSGCSMAGGEVPFDPTLPALAGLGLIALGLRRTRRS